MAARVRNQEASKVDRLAVFKNAPHPHAALLFADFVISPEGQVLLGQLGRVPTSKSVKTPMDTVKFTLIDPAAVNAEIKDLFAFRFEDFTLEGYDPHPAIKAPIAV